MEFIEPESYDKVVNAVGSDINSVTFPLDRGSEDCNDGSSVQLISEQPQSDSKDSSSLQLNSEQPQPASGGSGEEDSDNSNGYRNADLALCQICEKSIPVILFERHSEVCSDVHRAEMDLSFLNEELSEKKNIITDKLTSLQQELDSIEKDHPYFLVYLNKVIQVCTDILPIIDDTQNFDIGSLNLLVSLINQIGKFDQNDLDELTTATCDFTVFIKHRGLKSVIMTKCKNEYTQPNEKCLHVLFWEAESTKDLNSSLSKSFSSLDNLDASSDNLFEDIGVDIFDIFEMANSIQQAITQKLHTLQKFRIASLSFAELGLEEEQLMVEIGIETGTLFEEYSNPSVHNYKSSVILPPKESPLIMDVLGQERKRGSLADLRDGYRDSSSFVWSGSENSGVVVKLENDPAKKASSIILDDDEEGGGEVEKQNIFPSASEKAEDDFINSYYEGDIADTEGDETERNFKSKRRKPVRRKSQNLFELSSKFMGLSPPMIPPRSQSLRPARLVVSQHKTLDVETIHSPIVAVSPRSRLNSVYSSSSLIEPMMSVSADPLPFSGPISKNLPTIKDYEILKPISKGNFLEFY